MFYNRWTFFYRSYILEYGWGGDKILVLWCGHVFHDNHRIFPPYFPPLFSASPGGFLTNPSPSLFFIFYKTECGPEFIDSGRRKSCWKYKSSIVHQKSLRWIVKICSRRHWLSIFPRLYLAWLLMPKITIFPIEGH